MSGLDSVGFSAEIGVAAALLRILGMGTVQSYTFHPS